MPEETRRISITENLPDLGSDQLNDAMKTLFSLYAQNSAKMIEEFRQLKANIIASVSQATHGQEQNWSTRYLRLQSGGGGGTDFSIRYRNDTRDKSDPSGTHRLEWIAKSTATDPDTGNPWPDDQWSTVLNGEVMSE